MSIDKFNLPHMFFFPGSRHLDDAWQPRADVYRTHDGWLVKLELAGVRLDEIRLVDRGAEADRAGDAAGRALPLGDGLSLPRDRLQPLPARRGIARAFRRRRDR